MLKKKYERIFYNPITGISPIILFAILTEFIDLSKSLAYSILYGAILFFFFIKMLGKRVFQLFALTSLFSLLLFTPLFLFTGEIFLSKYSNIFIEVLFFLILSIFKLEEKRIQRFFDNYLKVNIKIAFKPALQLYFFVSGILMVFIPLHILVILLFHFSFQSFESDKILFFVNLLFPIAVFVVGLIEYMNIKWIGMQMGKERFVPIIDESARVIGHVALSESIESDKHFLHPIIRVMLKYDKKIYLRERPKEFLFEVGKMCLAIEDYVNYGENVTDAVNRILLNYIGKTKFQPRFLLKYQHTEGDNKRLNYLFMVCLDSEKVLKNKELRGGKLWTESQITENIGQNYFSDAFETEFDYIKSTVLMADNYCSCKANNFQI